MIAQETTENTISNTRTSFTIGPASRTCWKTRVSKIPAAAGTIIKGIPKDSIK